ncbi:MAG: cyclic nucleotide-binding domain-containing protein [Actinomycetia bacterium]|nr:cyclic nucleotide-binding domain-containing protein [Actinomycetes bacterium]
MKSIPDLLHEHPFFTDLPTSTLDLLAGCSINVHYSPDEMIGTAGQSADRFFVLRTGRVAIEIDTPRAGPVVIETLGPGEVLGVSWMLPPFRWTFDSRAIDATSAVSIDAACLRGKCDDDPALGYELFTRFAGLVRDRLQSTRLQLLDVYGSHAS